MAQINLKNHSVHAHDYTKTEIAGEVTVYAVAMDGPDEGPYLINAVAPDKATAIAWLEALDPSPWPCAVGGITEKK